MDTSGSASDATRSSCCRRSSTSARSSTGSKRLQRFSQRMRADVLLVGFGNVGRRFARLLDERDEILRRQHDLEPRIVGISTRRHGSAFAADGLDVTAMLESYASGRIAAETSEPGPDVTTLIERLAASEAPLRVLVET